MLIASLTLYTPGASEYEVPGAPLPDAGLHITSTPDNFTCRSKKETGAIAPPLHATSLMIWSVAGGTEQIGAVTVSPILVVTVPPNARINPIQVVSIPNVIPASSRIVPMNVVLAPSVVAWPGVQKTSQADVPESVTEEFATVVRAPLILNIYVPFPFKVIPAVPIDAAPKTQYTHGVNTPIDPCVVSVARSIAPGAKVKVHGCKANADRAIPWSMPAIA